MTNKNKKQTKAAEFTIYIEKVISDYTREKLNKTFKNLKLPFKIKSNKDK